MNVARPLLTARASDSVFHALTFCALQIVFMTMITPPAPPASVVMSRVRAMVILDFPRVCWWSKRTPYRPLVK